jgi:hypothetical protein
MVWVPTRGQRAKIRARFSDLAEKPQLPTHPTSAQKSESTNGGAAEAVATPMGISTLQANPILVNQTASVGRNGKKGTAPIPQKKGPDPCKEEGGWDIHHIPPRHPTRYILKRVKKKHHQYYHALFGAAASLEECIEILRRHWWPE